MKPRETKLNSSGTRNEIEFSFFLTENYKVLLEVIAGVGIVSCKSAV